MSDLKRLLDAPSALDDRARAALLAGRRLDPSRRDRDALWQSLASVIALPVDVGAPAGPTGATSTPPAAAPPAAPLASGASAALGAKVASVGPATKLASAGGAALKVTSAATGVSAAFKIATVGSVGLALAFGAHFLTQPPGALPQAVVSQGAPPPLPSPLGASTAQSEPAVALLEPASASTVDLGAPLDKASGGPGNTKPAEPTPLPPVLSGPGGASPRAGSTPFAAPLLVASPRAAAAPPAGAIGDASKKSPFNETTNVARPERVGPGGRAFEIVPQGAALSAGGRGEAYAAAPAGGRGEERVSVPAGGRGEARDSAPAATPATLAAGPPADTARAAADDDVIVESRQVGEVRRRLRGGDAAGALASLDGLARQFPQGVLAQERALLRVEALAGVGRRGEARAEAEAFVRAYPKSPFEGRVRALSR